MMKFLVKFATVVMIISMTSNAFGYCSDPDTPSFYGTKPSEPYAPYCVNTFSKTHTCNDWEIDSYNRDVETYNMQLRAYQRAVEDYINDLNGYVDDAVAYAECEVSQL